MYRTWIQNQQVVVRFTLSCQQKEEINEQQIIQTVLDLGVKLFSYINDSFAIKSLDGNLIIVYIQSGEVLDIQIQQVILKENILH
ncbi:hypothetical protein [Bacillus pinisoli]|uniref:hypothetical protein n=1 Tax=Bacillus pinisoli TaxID=2901866 RepID=UPI001FF6F031|nr:hypothetical protein [Bacillus pinisoli]